ncbi:MAG: ABC transporter ATPase [Ruminococcaceae bacterium]|nr:ABC transporter ATPase [Oscillospiraceae bacterium]
MEKLNTIQKRNKLNDVYKIDAPGAGGASHAYEIVKAEAKPSDCGDYLRFEMRGVVGRIVFQHGPRAEESSLHGVLDTDLLEIVRDRLKAFNQGEYATRENALAITHIEEALLWMNKRVEDRAERGVLGTTQK